MHLTEPVDMAAIMAHSLENDCQEKTMVHSAVRYKYCIVTSLPAGWHGIPVPTRNGVSNSTKTATVPTTIRKKWNSSMPSEVPRSKLPSYKPFHMRARKNPYGSLPATETSKSSCTGSQSELSSSVKSSLTKDLQNDIAKLKKELTTVKTENSILKVKVRRVDDENIQKSRQIEKLQFELKAAQKVQPINSKKNKDSELLLLRQKCLRLEGALREKDLSLNTFRKLNNESMKVEGAKAKHSSNNEGGDADDTQQDKLNETQTLSKSSFAANLPRSSQSSRSEVAKLRDIIHKLEKQNQDLEQQVKDKGEEIRCLKVHLKSQTFKSSQPAKTPVSSIPSKSSSIPSKSSIPNVSSKISALNTTSKSPLPITSKSSVKSISSKTSAPSISSKASAPNATSKSSIPNISSKTSSTNISSKVSQSKPPIKKTIKSAPSVSNKAQKSQLKGNLASNVKAMPHKDLKASVVTANKTSIVPRPKKMSDPSIKSNNGQQKNKDSSTSGSSKLQAPQKQANGVQTKQADTKNAVSDSVGMKPKSTEAVADLGEDAQRLRENIAAKKIQRGWHMHQKRPENSENHQNLQKAMTFIVTSIKHHKSRKEKLNLLRKRKNPSPKQKVENEDVLVAAIREATKNLWAKELNPTN